AGELGEVVSVHVSAWLMKPGDYFDVAWRRATGGGPILINLIHDIDLLRHLVGDVVEVTALSGNAVRGFEVEDTAAVALRFACGALGTLSLTDAVPAPWSWELTAGENPAYPVTNAVAGMIGGTEGSLEIPSGALWSQRERSWWAPMSRTQRPREREDPLVAQIEHFVDVIRGEAEPLVSGLDGLKAVAIVEAIQASAASGRAVVPAV
ncbi:MAG: Gfo/Idh/MocA family oxidoreductase, partial [Pseudomonadota bacterium]